MKKYLITLILCISCAVCCCGKFTATAETESSALGVYTRSSGLIAPPAIVTELSESTDIARFRGLASTKMVRPATMIAETDEHFQVSTAEGKLDFDAFFATYLKNKMLPAVRVESYAAADVYIEYLKETKYVDFAVVSTDIAIVKYVKESYPYIRGIIDYTKTDVSERTAGSVAVEANANYAITVILTEEQATQNFVYDIQARFKTVWIKSNATTPTGIAANVACGAFGIITDNFALAYDTFETFENGTLARAFYNIGHRGLPEAVTENTLEGCIAAYEAGATHFEIDAKICASGEIVIIHDDDLFRMAGVSGTSIYSMTLEEIRKYKINKGYSGQTFKECDVPILDDILEYFKDKKDVVIIVEIKNTQSNFAKELRKVIEKYDAFEQVVCIAFSTSQLKEMRDVLPEIPTADLNDTDKTNFIGYVKTACEYNMGINPSKSSIGTARWLFNNFIARGFMPYYWTQYTAADTKNAVDAGCVGITTNYADALGGYAKYVQADSLLNLSAENEGVLAKSVFPINAVKYNGQIATVNAQIFSYDLTEIGCTAVLKYSDNGIVRLTEPVEIAFKGSELPPETSESGSLPEESGSSQTPEHSENGSEQSQTGSETGCLGNCGGSIGGFSVVLFGIAAGLFTVKIIKRR